MRGGKRRRGLCRGCLVGSSEAPTQCPTAFVWYFINTSANYFPFFTGASTGLVAESGMHLTSTRCVLLSRIARACASPRKAAGRLYRYRAYVQASRRYCANVCTRERTHSHRLCWQKKKKDTVGRTVSELLRICEQHQRVARIILRCRVCGVIYTREVDDQLRNML